VETYLVLVDCFLSSDGGHINTKAEAFWVKASDKRNAASTAALHARSKYTSSLVKDRVVRVISREQWGKVYFETIREEDYTHG